MNPQKHVLKLIFLIAVIVLAGFFIFGKNNSGLTGKVISTGDTAVTPAQPAVAPIIAGKVFLLGGNTINNSGQSPSSYYNDVWQSSDMSNWTLISPDMANPGNLKWTQRTGQTALYFQNKLWVIGGQDAQGNASNEVWSSSDGINWILAGHIGSNFNSYLAGHTSVVFDKKMWVMGGHTGVSLWNDVYSSPDGITWTHVTTAPWSVRYGHTSVVYNNKIWVMGGAIGMGAFINDVWSSPDGVNWTQATSSASWTPRYGASIGVYNNKMYLFSGSDLSGSFSDVYSSTNGITWAAVPQNQWPARTLGESAVFNSRMYLLGGSGSSPSYPQYNDIWSFNGPSWQSINQNPAWSKRSGHSVVVAQ